MFDVTIDIFSNETVCQTETAFNFKNRQNFDLPVYMMYPSGTFGFRVAFGHI